MTDRAHDVFFDVGNNKFQVELVVVVVVWLHVQSVCNRHGDSESYDLPVHVRLIIALCGGTLTVPLAMLTLLNPEWVPWDCRQWEARGGAFGQAHIPTPCGGVRSTVARN